MLFPSDAAGNADPEDKVKAKHELYDEVYDPLTARWFEELANSAGRKRLLDTAAGRDLLANLTELDDVVHEVVDSTLSGLPADEKARILDWVRRLRSFVMWEGQQVPRPQADEEELTASLGYKLKRNICLGAVEAVICLQSALIFGRDQLELRGKDLLDALLRSRQLYGSLAYLHDEQEQTRLQFLTGVPGYLKYPEVSYQQVLEGLYFIPADKFTTVGPPDAPILRFVSTPPHRAALDTPTKRCPAHRLRNPRNEVEVLNDVLWALLIEIYRLSGAFGSISADGSQAATMASSSATNRSA